MLTSFGRNRIISLGDPQARMFHEMCEALGLSVERRKLGPLDVSEPDLLAILTFIDSQNYTQAQGQIVTLIAQNALEYGVFLATVSLDRKLALTARANAIAAMEKHSKPRVLRGEKLPDFGAIGPPSEIGDNAENVLASELARALRDHQTERPADRNLHIGGEIGDEFWEQDQILLRRAFNGFTRIDLKQETGGRSPNCSVWRVVAEKGPNVLEPFIAKAALREDLEYELRNYQDMVRDHVPFPFRAPIIESRFVRGGVRALLVSAFVTRAQRFDEYLCQSLHPELPVATLFHNALANWRRHATLLRNVSIGAAYVSRQETATTEIPNGTRPLLPDPQLVAQAYADCRAKKWKAKSPADLWKELRSLPEGDYWVSGVHGDLNVRNIFVRWNVSDTILIDFSHAGLQDFLARDPAKLETSIALSCADRTKRLLSLQVLRELYCPPLLPMRGHIPADGRIEAIRQIRRQVGGEGISHHEYSVVAACHLLRYASAPPGADPKLAPRRALCYSLACLLIEKC